MAVLRSQTIQMESFIYFFENKCRGAKGEEKRRLKKRKKEKKRKGPKGCCPV
jgi:hypothetical protein